MGMFDYIKCKFPLPRKFREYQNLQFQTKDTPSQFLDNYSIRIDGTLYHQNYKILDKSDKKATGLDRLIGCMTRVKTDRTKEKNFNGEIRFYDCLGKHCSGWIEFSAQFKNGKTTRIKLLNYRPPNKADEDKKEENLKLLLNSGDL